MDAGVLWREDRPHGHLARALALCSPIPPLSITVTSAFSQARVPCPSGNGRLHSNCATPTPGRRNQYITRLNEILVDEFDALN